jgi:hypothetical protein
MDDRILMFEDLKYLLSDRFPRSAERIQEIRDHVEQTQKDLVEILEVIQWMERLQQQKNIMSN